MTPPTRRCSLRLRLATTAFVLASLAPAVHAAPDCSATGAYGLAFAAKPGPDAKRLWGGNASVWYAVQAPEHIEHFD